MVATASIIVALSCWFVMIFPKIHRCRKAFEECISGNATKLKSPLIVFDFDGTICRSFPLVVEVINAISEDYGIKKINNFEAECFRSLSSKGVLKKLGFSWFQLPFVIKRLRDEVKDKVADLEIVSDMVVNLKKLHKMGLSLAILTSNSEENVRLFLRKHEIDFFDLIYTSNHLFGKSQMLKNLMKVAQLSPRRDMVIYIGDETRDIIAAKKADVASIAVSWGFNTSEALKKAKPDMIADIPDQLFEYIRSKETP